jgi:hypothetical protein
MLLQYCLAWRRFALIAIGNGPTVCAPGRGAYVALPSPIAVRATDLVFEGQVHRSLGGL